MNNRQDIKDHIVSVLSKKPVGVLVAEKVVDIEKGDVSPFFLALFDKKLTLITKISQSYQTSFGMKLWEQISKKLAENEGWECETQYKLLGSISPDCRDYIHELLEDKEYEPNREEELEKLKEKSKGFNAELEEFPDSTVDVFIKTTEGVEYCIDITTVKPSKKEFRTLKRKMLMWAALRYSQNPEVDFQPYIAIPYNPCKGDYNRHQGNYDREDLLVGDELWKKVSNDQCGMEDLVGIFQEIGNGISVAIEEAVDNHN